MLPAGHIILSNVSFHLFHPTKNTVEYPLLTLTETNRTKIINVFLAKTHLFRETMKELAWSETLHSFLFLLEKGRETSKSKVSKRWDLFSVMPTECRVAAYFMRLVYYRVTYWFCLLWLIATFRRLLHAHRTRFPRNRLGRVAIIGWCSGINKCKARGDIPVTATHGERRWPRARSEKISAHLACTVAERYLAEPEWSERVNRSTR